MNLKNYTSAVPAERSIAMIEKRLVDSGATNIVKRYDDKRRLQAILFQIPRGEQLFPILLPARVDGVFRELWKEVKRPRPDTAERVREQAERTAWKIVSDWLEVQFSMIRLEQAEFLEVFLPYLWDAKHERTFFNALKADGFKQLAPKHE